MPASISSPPPSPGARGALSFQSLHFEGPDSLAFLQSQLSSDVSALGDAAWHWSAWLSAKGRVLALGLLYRRQPEHFEWLLPDADASALAPQLQRFVLRRKVSLRAEHLVLACGFGTGAAGDRGVLRLSGAPSRWIAPDSTHPGTTDPDFGKAWRQLDYLQGVPRLDAANAEFTGHMLSLQRLDALSLSKGCYPGQEIVARTHYLGQSRRGLACLRLSETAEVPRGADILAGDQSIGTVLGSVTVASDTYVQAVVAGMPTEERASVQGLSAVAVDLLPAPLPEG